MTDRNPEMLRGTVELLILTTLSRGRLHGFGIARWLEAASDDELQLEEGSLYPALHRMERRGWVESEWGISERNRQVKLYRLTPGGRARLRSETHGWDSVRGGHRQGAAGSGGRLMARVPMWRRYLRFWGTDVRADVDAELAFHVDELVDRLVQQGRDPAEARMEAARRFGDYGRIRAACVDIDRRRERQRRWRQLLADLRQDLRLGVRTLTKNRGFTLSAVIILGVGLGAATVMASVINSVFLRPLQFPEPDRIVNVVEYGPSGLRVAQPQAAVALLRDASRAFSTLAGVGGSPGMNLVSDHGSTYIRNLEVTAGYFRVLGVEPRLGRAFSRDDESAPSTVVLSHRVWAGHFGGEPGILGGVVRLGGRPYTVIGVMPSGFWSFEQAEAWTPFRPDPRDFGRNHELIGRLAPGWTAPQAEAELQALATSLLNDLNVEALVPEGVTLPETVRVGVQPHRDVLADASGATVWPLAAAVGAMLLIVCANTAALQLARGVGRRRELAVRAALGGASGRLLRQLLTESILLSTAGGAVGWWPRYGPSRGSSRSNRSSRSGVSHSTCRFCAHRSRLRWPRLLPSACWRSAPNPRTCCTAASHAA